VPNLEKEEGKTRNVNGGEKSNLMGEESAFVSGYRWDFHG